MQPGFLGYTGSYTDLYELTMSEVYFLSGRGVEQVVFDYFFRKIPFGGGYVVFAGLESLIDILEQFRFTDEDLAYLKQEGFHPQFLEHLKDFRFTGSLYSVKEGEIVFPIEPILQLEGNIIEAQLLETIILNHLNFQSLIATKASRIRRVAGDRKLIDFGLRRAHGPAGYFASRAAIVGVFDGTSNVTAGRDFNIPVSGTMAHSFIQNYPDELQAFREYARYNQETCVLLVDTYSTLDSGLPNAIIVGKELEKQGYRLQGIRLDSGDLAYLARESRRQLDAAGLEYVNIITSNQLDESVIKSLLEQKAPIDVFGVGTSLVTGQPDAALDGVYKLSMRADVPTIKISESTEKITIPHRKQLYRLLADDGRFSGTDAISIRDEKDIDWIFHPHDPYKSMSISETTREPLLFKRMEKGLRHSEARTLIEIKDYCAARLKQLPPEYKRFNNPHIYKVSITEALKSERDDLIQKFRR